VDPRRPALHTLIQNTLELEGFPVHRSSSNRIKRRQPDSAASLSFHHMTGTRAVCACLFGLFRLIVCRQGRCTLLNGSSQPYGWCQNDCAEDTKHADTEEDRHRFWASEPSF